MSASRVSVPEFVRMGVKQLLRPVLGFCLRRGLRFQELVQLTKECFLDVARAELERRGEEVNTSRLSVLTGLQRRDIRQQLSPEFDSARGVNLLSRVIGQWQTHPDMTTTAGKPRRLSADGSESEWAELVRSVSVDVNPYTVLFALEQSGTVRRHDGEVELLESVYAPRENVAAGLEMLGSDAGSLIRAIEENLFSRPQTPNLHIATTYDNITIESLAEIRAWLLDRGTTLHEAAREFVAKRDKDANPRLHAKQGGGRVTLCTFSLVEEP